MKAVINTTQRSAISLSGAEQIDEEIRFRLNALTQDSSYWDFRRSAKRSALHGVTQYPAMMVPAMQG